MAFAFLKTNDCIGIAAPASSFSKDDFLDGVDVLKSLGYRVYYRADIFSEFQGFAGDDERRLNELHELFAKSELKAIMFARGGWGIQRIISRLNKGLIRRCPKLVLGYSDLTTLHQYLYTQCKWPFFYAPVLAKDLHSALSDSALGSLASCLSGSFQKQSMRLPDTEILHPGTAKGPIVGGCLTLLMTASGTPYSLSFKNKILFIEDVNEKPYQIDRMLTHLRETGRLQGVKGLLCGQFKDCGDPAEIKALVLGHFKPYKIPILWNAPYGHGFNMHCLPLGVDCILQSAPRPSLEFKQL